MRAVCTLQLDGCCYIADSHRLSQRLEQLANQPATWPYLISFEGTQPQQLPPHRHDQLQQQLRRLHAAVAAGVAASAVAGYSGSIASINLSLQQGLPTMPTLNGLLLGYPVVYCVWDQADAAAGSRMLSAAELKLHRIVGRCDVLARLGLGAAGAPIKQHLQVSVEPGGNAAAGGAVVVLQSFTVPDSVWGEEVEGRVPQVLQQLQACAAHNPGCWHGIELVTSVVGPQAVSL